MRQDRGHRAEMKYMRCLDARLCESLRPGVVHRIRSVVVGSGCYRNEVGSSIPGQGK